MRISLVTLGLTLCGAVAVAHAGALDQPAFTATPAELLAAARPALATDAPVVVLADDTTVTFDDAGRATTRVRMVGVIVQPAAVDAWGTVQLDWRPFYQDRPTVRARVIAPDGTVAELDPSLVSDSPAMSESPSVFSDRRVMAAPLPRLTVGAVVEQELVISDRAPLLAAGVVMRLHVAREVPIARARVTIDAPARRPPRIVARGFATAPTARTATRGGRTTWIYDLGAVPVAADRVVGAPPDAAAAPYIGVATAASWAAVAADYARLIAPRPDAPLALPPGLAATTPRATVERIVAWLHASVRYTGIELGDSALVPGAPASTLARGFGDGKDNAALLVAALRAAGVDADLALLATGPASDLDRDLPGMGRFDHAIVRARVDGKDLWLDPTEPDLAVGQLPARAQGRRALVIRADTRDLITTPAATAADSAIREVRRYQLAELGGARVTERTRESGLFAANLRTWLRDSTRAEVTASLTTYAEREYRGRLRSFTSGDPTAAAPPFELTVEIEDAQRAATGGDQADVYLFPHDALERLPAVFTSEDDAALAARTLDYVWWIPHVYEIEHRIVLPPGFTAPALVAREPRALGTLTLTTTRRTDGDEVVITYRLDTGKRRITAAELRAGRTAVRALQAGEGEHLVLVPVGAALVQDGKLREAIAEYQRLIALHPREALHHVQLAAAYRAAGQGPAARRTARTAVTVEPTAALAHVALARHLRVDSLGREAGYDADRAGALAAYRQALAVAPADIDALEGLATLLSIDARGWPTAVRADQREAIALMRRARDASGSTRYDLDLAGRLLISEQYAEAEAAARALPASDERSALLVAIAGATRGGDAARQLARSLATGADRHRVLTGARAWSLQGRHYDAMRALHAELGETTQPAVEQVMARLTRGDLGALPPADPRTPVLYALAVAADLTVPVRPWSTTIDAELARGALDRLVGAFGVSQRSMPPALVFDLARATATLTVDGAPATGWRVTVDTGSRPQVFYVGLVKKRAQLLGATALPAGLGRSVLTAVAARDVAGAARWLERLAHDTPPLWPSAAGIVRDLHAAELAGQPSPDADVVQLAAAVLLADDEPATTAPLLRRCAELVEPVRRACREVQLRGLRALGRWDEAAELAGVLDDGSPRHAVRRAPLLARAGKVAEAIALVDQTLAKAPDDLDLLDARADLTALAEGWAAARPWHDRLAASPAANQTTFNNVAWAYLFHDASPTAARAIAARGEQAAPTLSPFFANTLAAIEAAANHPAPAWRYLQQSHRNGLDEPPTDADRYVLGRIAESLGLRDDAIAAYRQLPARPNSSLGPTSYDFAAQGLARLGAAPPP